MSEKKITLAIIGSGSRGLLTFGEYVRQHPDQAKVVAVAEPREYFRNQAIKQHQIEAENVFHSWQELLDRPRLADAVIIATPDRLHVGPALKAAEKGYHILLEKPMAPKAEECFQIAKVAEARHIILAVCHVLRYAPYYEKIKAIIDSGQIGALCTLNHIEGVGWWHQAHSYVRGKFQNEADSSFMLLAKSCHDIDIIRWWIGKRCLNVASFGALKHFDKANKPANAADRCMDCSLADALCPYSAKSFYFDRLRKKQHYWPLNMVVNEFTETALEKALRTGPYGQCVYACDNDVVDHQVVAMEYEDKISANFTMTAFTPHGRQTRIMGSRGYLEGDEKVIRVFDFCTQEWTQYDVNKLATDLTGGHGGGDQRLMQAFIDAVRTNNPDLITTGGNMTLESHLIVFAAELARNERKVINIEDFQKTCNRRSGVNV